MGAYSSIKKMKELDKDERISLVAQLIGSNTGETTAGTSATPLKNGDAIMKAIDGVTYLGPMFYQCGSMVVTFLPSSVSIIERTFYNCHAIKITEIPSSVTKITNYSFSNCTGLTSLTFKGTPTLIQSLAFSGCTSITDIYVPWSEGTVANAPWGATNATIHYDTV